jgi:predicted ATP-grasp superfamily ATP-dependent carboligase
MRKAPKSYKNRRRPPLDEAILAEGKMTLKEALASLERKGYFTARPRPWNLGFRHRGHGHGDYAVLDRFGDLVAEKLRREDAELIIAAVNAYKP